MCVCPVLCSCMSQRLMATMERVKEGRKDEDAALTVPPSFRLSPFPGYLREVGFTQHK